ncbi:MULTISPECIES: acyl carrier protein [unclassified Streptomyces]|uniref:acyl carrier protein n=1 Tax=unclassified Streptomyces TaxID=2593676 RepID=UPI0033B75A24
MDRRAEIKQFVIDEFAVGISADELPDDYDLLANGVIDSLGLLTLVSWLENRYALGIDAMDVSPLNFRTVEAIATYLGSATPTAGAQ